MKNIACGGQSILLVVISLLLRRVDTEKISKWQTSSCMPGHVLGQWVEGAGLLELYVHFSLGRIVAAWFTCTVLWIKSWSVRGACHHPAFMGNWRTISYTSHSLTTQMMKNWRINVLLFRKLNLDLCGWILLP